MSKKIQVMCYVTIMVVALSAALVLYMLTPVCSNCGSKFCFGRCLIVYNINNPNPNTIRPDAPQTNQNTTRLVETEEADDSYFDKITFIGDSRTVGLVTYGIKEENIYADDGLNHEQAMTKEVVRLNESRLTTIADAVSVTAPDIMLINFGINGAAYMPTDAFMEGYKKLIESFVEASPNSIVILEAIMPVSLAYSQTNDGCSNEKIDEINDAIYGYAAERGFYYLATNEALKNSSNNLENDYHRGDGIHYNKAAYEVILQYIKTHAVYRK